MNESPSGIRILLADDHELVLKGLVRVLLASHPEWQIAGQAANAAEAIEAGLREKPDVAILDLSMPDASGLEVAQRLLAEVPGIRVLILTMHAAAPIVRQLRKAGIHAFLAKNEAPAKLVQAVERVLAGDRFFASISASREHLDLPEYIPVQFLLTPRELDVLRMLARGRSNKELAGDLEMSVRTAESHHANIMAKLEVNSLADLIRVAIRDNVT